MSRTVTYTALVVAGLALSGCPQQPADTPAGATQSDETAGSTQGALVVYCGRGEGLVGPLFAKFTEQTGIEVSPQYGGTPALATQLANEGQSSPADLIFAQDSGYLGALSRQELLEALPQALLDKVDARFRDPQGRWLGTSGRARCLVYATQALEPQDLPASLKDLTDPKWKDKLGWAPGNGSFQAHVSALRHLWGDDATREWLQGVQANEPKVYPKNSPQVQAAIDGEIQIGWVNHYYLHRQGPDVPAANYSFRTEQDAGNVLMVAGAGIRRGSPRRAAALQLLEFLVSETGQRHFTQETFEYPTVPDFPTHERVPPLESLNLADVDQTFLADVGSTLAMLQELGLQ